MHDSPSHDALSDAQFFGTVRAVCVSERKGTVKTPVQRITCHAEMGVEGDAHAHGGPRQVSFLAEKDCAIMRTRGVEPLPGIFAENIRVDGNLLEKIAVGMYICAGDDGPVFQVTMIGKDCHDDGCAIRRTAGVCVMPTHGVFARVISDGALHVGDILCRRDAL